jgi:coenzyme F420-reducing hydrogenase alpha subunit
MARFTLNHDQLTPRARAIAEEVGLAKGERNPFKSIIVRSVEIVLACEEILRLIGEYERPPEPWIPVESVDSVGHGASEAPRGTLYHRYEINPEGLIADAKIVPPTSQNQCSIEADLWKFVEPRTRMDDDKLKWQLEQAIRNYDPCISCATHFLDLTIERADQG